MLPLTLGLFVYSLFMRVGYSVCVTLPMIILIIYHLPLYSQWYIRALAVPSVNVKTYHTTSSRRRC